MKIHAAFIGLACVAGSATMTALANPIPTELDTRVDPAIVQFLSDCHAFTSGEDGITEAMNERGWSESEFIAHTMEEDGYIDTGFVVSKTLGSGGTLELTFTEETDPQSIFRCIMTASGENEDAIPDPDTLQYLSDDWMYATGGPFGAKQSWIFLELDYFNGIADIPGEDYPNSFDLLVVRSERY